MSPLKEALSLSALPPQIIQFPEDQKVRAGESVELLCKVTGTLPLTCTWMKFRKQVILAVSLSWVESGGAREEKQLHGIVHNS